MNTVDDWAWKVIRSCGLSTANSDINVIALHKDIRAMLRQQQAEIEALKLRELTDEEIKEVYDQYFDLENFGWLHLQCIREILEKAREK